MKKIAEADDQKMIIMEEHTDAKNVENHICHTLHYTLTQKQNTIKEILPIIEVEEDQKKILEKVFQITNIFIIL